MLACTLLGSGRCSAFCSLVLLCEVGPAGPAPARLPSSHHLPPAGGQTQQHVWCLEACGRKQRWAWEEALAPVLGVDCGGGYQLSLHDLPSPGTCLRLPLRPLQLCLPVPCLIHTQAKCALMQHK